MHWHFVLEKGGTGTAPRLDPGSRWKDPGALSGSVYSVGSLETFPSSPSSSFCFSSNLILRSFHHTLATVWLAMCISVLLVIVLVGRRQTGAFPWLPRCARLFSSRKAEASVSSPWMELMCLPDFCLSIPSVLLSVSVSDRLSQPGVSLPVVQYGSSQQALPGHCVNISITLRGAEKWEQENFLYRRISCNSVSASSRQMGYSVFRRFSV